MANVFSINALHSETRELTCLEIDKFGGFSKLVLALKKAFQENRDIKNIFIIEIYGADIQDDSDVTFLNKLKTLMVTFGNDEIPPKPGTAEYLRTKLKLYAESIQSN